MENLKIALSGFGFFLLFASAAKAETECRTYPLDVTVCVSGECETEVHAIEICRHGWDRVEYTTVSEVVVHADPLAEVFADNNDPIFGFDFGGV